MTLLPKHLTVIACIVALTLAGCVDPPASNQRVTARLTLASLGNTTRAVIDSADRPEPPAGFSDHDMDVPRQADDRCREGFILASNP